MSEWVKNKVSYSPKKDFLTVRTRFQGFDSQKRGSKKYHKLVFHSVKWKIVSRQSYSFEEIVQIKFW